MAAEAVGNRRKQGRDGLVGYLTWLATAEPKAFAALLGRTLPLQVTGVNNGPLQMVTITMTAKEAQSAYQATLKSREPLLLPGP